MAPVPTNRVAAFTLLRSTSQTIKKAAFLLFSLAVLLLSGAAAVRGQSALDGFDPNVAGVVHDVVVQPDGKILIAGIFNSVLGIVPRNHITRLNPDGTLDTAFDPNPNGPVLVVMLQQDSKILIGGNFTTVSGVPRNHLARLNVDGTLDTNFNPDADGTIFSIAVQADGKILLGGAFTSIGGQMRNGIVRLDATTGLADSFNPNANDGVHSIVGAGRRQNFSGRRFHEHRRTDAQPYRPTRCQHRLS